MMFTSEIILTEERACMKSKLRLTAMMLPVVYRAAGTYATTLPAPQFGVRRSIQEGYSLLRYYVRNETC